jgi:hypothetical protein
LFGLLLGLLGRAHLLALLAIDLPAGAGRAAFAEHLPQVLPGFDQFGQGGFLDAAGRSQVLLFQFCRGGSHGRDGEVQARHWSDALGQLLGKLLRGGSQFAFRLGQPVDVLVIGL